ncbi:MAG: hypothetical protein Kow00124_28010 [Anaerolineae bacterium]
MAHTTAAARAGAEKLLGRTLGRYTLVELIGLGGMGTVYRARQAQAARDVAIKVVAGPLADRPAFMRRFVQEAQAGAQLQHPHILPIYDVCADSQPPYLVMPYLPGGTLARRIAAAPGGLPPAEVVRVTTQIASALDYLHQRGIVHRDLKPGNILFDADGNAYLGDFGIARLVDQEGGAGAAPGTREYRAPEVAAGDPATPASDIYALGMVAFEMLTGRRADPQMMCSGGLSPLNPRCWRPDLPPGVGVVLQQALDPEPGGRPARASALAAALSHAFKMAGPPPAAPLPEALPAASAAPPQEDAPAEAVGPIPLWTTHRFTPAGRARTDRPHSLSELLDAPPPEELAEIAPPADEEPPAGGAAPPPDEVLSISFDDLPETPPSDEPFMPEGWGPPLDWLAAPEDEAGPDEIGLLDVPPPWDGPDTDPNPPTPPWVPLDFEDEPPMPPPRPVEAHTPTEPEPEPQAAPPRPAAALAEHFAVTRRHRPALGLTPQEQLTVTAVTALLALALIVLFALVMSSLGIPPAA